MRRFFISTVFLMSLLVACDQDTSPPDVGVPLAGDPTAAGVPSAPAELVPDDVEGAVALNDGGPAFSLTMPGGDPQQLPDEALGGIAPLTPSDAMDEAVRRLERRAEAVGDGVVLAAGMDHHGIPMEPESTDPADLDPDVPALVADPTSLDPATTYADCRECRNTCRILKCSSGDFGRVNNTGFKHIYILIFLSIEPAFFIVTFKKFTHNY